MCARAMEEGAVVELRARDDGDQPMTTLPRKVFIAYAGTGLISDTKTAFGEAPSVVNLTRYSRQSVDAVAKCMSAVFERDAAAAQLQAYKSSCTHASPPLHMSFSVKYDACPIKEARLSGMVRKTTDAAEAASAAALIDGPAAIEVLKLARFLSFRSLAAEAARRITDAVDANNAPSLLQLEYLDESLRERVKTFIAAHIEDVASTQHWHASIPPRDKERILAMAEGRASKSPRPIEEHRRARGVRHRLRQAGRDEGAAVRSRGARRTRCDALRAHGACA